MRFSALLAAFSWVMLLVARCGTVPLGAQQRPSCYDEGGLLKDTLYLGARLTTVSPPAPRLQQLAPYPPAAAGESTITFGGETYYANGLPVRVLPENPEPTKLVRIGAAGAIPLYLLEVDMIKGHRHTLWAPITEDCIFLPFTHESEMR